MAAAVKRQQRFGHLEVITVKEGGRGLGHTALCYCHNCGGTIVVPVSHLSSSGRTSCGCPRGTVEALQRRSKTYEVLHRTEEFDGSGVRLYDVRCKRCGTSYRLSCASIAQNKSGRCKHCAKKPYNVNGKPASLRELAKHEGVSYSSLNKYTRKKGVPVQEAVDHVRRAGVERVEVGVVVNGNKLVRRVQTAKTPGSTKYFWVCLACGHERRGPPAEVAKKKCQRCHFNMITNKYELCGEKLTVRELSELYGVGMNTLIMRFRAGWTLPQALGLHPPPRKEKK